MILALIGQCNWTVYATVHAARGQLHLNVFFTTHLRVKSIFFPKSSFLTSFLNFVIVTIDQFRYIKIQPKTIDLSTRLVGINTEFVGFIPKSLVLRSIV